MEWNIYYKDCDFNLGIQRLLSLFFEEPTIHFHNGKFDKNIERKYPTILIKTHEGVEVEARLTLYPAEDAPSLTMAYEEKAVAIDPLEQKKHARRVISHGLLQLLEQYTGITQPWGTLTGIRPTKLLHSLLQEGKTREEAAQILKEERLITPDKILLLQEIVDRQFQVIPDLNTLNDKEVSIYIGIPFCPTKCAYCTFPAYSIQGQKKRVDPFLDCLKEEIRLIGEWLKKAGKGITTVYFGGGTPTSIEASQLDELFQALHRYMPMENVRELTVEAGRPDTITQEKLEAMKKWQVDRISINPQSFTQETLQAIGRHHTVEETLEKYRLARDYGFTNINMDLIIGLPGETRVQLQDSLKQAAELRPESLTVHTLSFKRASEMTQNKEKYPVAGREEIHHMMEIVEEWTRMKGYVPYYLYRQKNILGNLENVGYSLQNKESMYNIIIMEEKQTILGLGCGAVSKIIPPGTQKILRWPNPKEPQYYVDHFYELMVKKIEKLNKVLP